MSLWDRFRGKPPEPTAPPALPALPADGVIEAFDVADAVGTIRLATGDAVRFGRSACDFEPVVGLFVRVLAADVGPLARVRATQIERRTGADEHQRLLTERDRAAGFPARGDSSKAEGLKTAKLCVTTTRPIPDGAALRRFWERAALDSVAKLDFVPGPVTLIEGRPFEVLFGSGPLDSELDLRFQPPDSVLGDSFVGFWDGESRACAIHSSQRNQRMGFRPERERASSPQSGGAARALSR